MTLRIGRPARALIVAPHPDDEVIGAAGLIRALVRRGTAVRIVVVTDGAGSHRASVAWPARRLVAARRIETRRAAARLGLPASAIVFLSQPDGGARADDCHRLLAREVRRRARLALIVGPAAGDAHPDHRAVAAALDRLRHPARRLRYRVWPPRAAGRGPTLGVSVSVAAKRSLIRVHATQLGLIRDDPAGFAIARHELDAFARSPERYGVRR